MSKSETPNPSAPSTPLPDIDDLFHTVQGRLNEQKPPTYRAKNQVAASSDAATAAPYVRAAAVLNTFDHKSLQPLADPDSPAASADRARPDHPAQQVLEYSTLVYTAQGEMRWSLNLAARRTALAELLAANQIEAALNANRALAYNQNDPVQRMLTAVLTGALAPVSQLRLEELTALQSITPWVKRLKLPQAFPPTPELRRQLERERLLEPFRFLIGRWENGVFIEHFRGRQSELQRLREYVDVAPSESIFEGVMRGLISATETIFDFHKRPPLVIHGPGGVGKSTLVAKFLLQHVEAQQTQQFAFVYIDFDRPDILIAEPRTLLSEGARQLAYQYPKAEKRFLDYHQRLHAERPATLYGQENETDGVRLQEVFDPFIAELAQVHNREMPDRPLLLVLDTFEEIQQRSRDYVRGLFDFLNQLQGAIPRLRTVLAGRAPVTEEEAGFPTENLALLDLDTEAARAFLKSQNIPDAWVANEIMDLVGRQPLALKLAAELATEHGLREVVDASAFDSFRQAWTQTAVTGRLYERLLLHITDPDVRRLAHPGLVLRRITPDLIQTVLATPCGVAVPDAAAAQDLFERLQWQVSLVAPTEPGVLRHRADVRQIMLPLILADKAEQARQIQEAAVAFYAQQSGTAARAEEIYHRLLLGESPRTVERRWINGLDEHLRPALDELPPKAQAFVAARIGSERPDAIWQAADVEDWERYAEGRVRRLLRMQKPAEAEQVLRMRRDRSASGRLLGLEALVQAAQGRMEHARVTARRALNGLRHNHANADLAAELERLLTAKS
jgi:hypothetical protein